MVGEGGNGNGGDGEPTYRSLNTLRAAANRHHRNKTVHYKTPNPDMKIPLCSPSEWVGRMPRFEWTSHPDFVTCRFCKQELDILEKLQRGEKVRHRKLFNEGWTDD